MLEYTLCHIFYRKLTLHVILSDVILLARVLGRFSFCFKIRWGVFSSSCFKSKYNKTKQHTHTYTHTNVIYILIKQQPKYRKHIFKASDQSYNHIFCFIHRVFIHYLIGVFIQHLRSPS